MDRKIVLALCVVLVLGAALFFSGGGDEAKETVRVSGAWALYPLMVKWADEYQKANPGVSIEVNAGGAGKGMADALGGLVDIGMISRDIDKSEIGKGAYPIAVAKDAVLPTMNRDNPAAQSIRGRGVKMGEFKDVFVTGSVTEWGMLSGRPDVRDKISVYVRSDSCGAGEVWGKYLGVKQEDLVGVGVNGDPGIAEAVSRDVRGMGFNNLNFAYDDRTGKPVGNIVIVPLDLNSDGVVSADEDFYADKSGVVKAIADGRFPSPPARDLYIVTKGEPKGAARDFIMWILTDGQGQVLPAGYIPLKGDAISAEAEKLR